MVRIDTPDAKLDTVAKRRAVLPAVDIPDASGTLPDNYMQMADEQLGKLLGAACMKGTVKVSVVLVRSSIKPNPTDAELDSKRLSDWLPAELVFKNPKPKC